MATHFGAAVPIRLVVDDDDSDEGPAVGRRAPDPGRAVDRRGAPGPPPCPSVRRRRRRRRPTPVTTTTPDLLDPAVLAAETEPAGAGLSARGTAEAGLPRRRRRCRRVRRPAPGPGRRARPAARASGPKSAQRIAFHLLKVAPEDAIRLAEPIVAVKERITLCPRCFNVAEGDLCAICDDSRRDGTVLCVVEDPRDIVAVEKTQEFRGRYHVLHGALNPIEGVGPDQLRVEELLGAPRRRRR